LPTDLHVCGLSITGALITEELEDPSDGRFRLWTYPIGFFSVLCLVAAHAAVFLILGCLPISMIMKLQCVDAIVINITK
jgi:hypothetical protein